MKTTQPLLLTYCIFLSVSTASFADNQTLSTHKNTLRIQPSTEKTSPNTLGTVRKGNKIVSHCWTTKTCSQMISDCLSVGGHFKEGVQDPNTSATSEGSCRL